jgi:hypothetical protein
MAARTAASAGAVVEADEDDVGGETVVVVPEGLVDDVVAGLVDKADELDRESEPEAHAARGTTATKIKAMRVRRTALLRFRR